MPLNGAKQRAKNAQATKKRKAEEQAASISVIEAEIEAAASSQQLVADGARLHSPTLACSVCADALAGLTAADVLSGCMTCNSCGTRVPPRTVADATAIVRHATSLAPIDCAVPRRRSAAAAPPSARPHGGAPLRAMLQRYDAELLQRFEDVNGPLELGARSHWREHAPVRIRCSECHGVWYFDYIWMACHRMGLADDFYKAYLDSPARLEVLNSIVPSLKTRLRAVRLPCSTPVVLPWSTCFNCETARAVQAQAEQWRSAAADRLKPKLTALQKLGAGLISFGVNSSAPLDIPFSRDTMARRASCRVPHRAAHVLLVPEEIGDGLTQEELDLLRAAPYSSFLFDAPAVRIPRGKVGEFDMSVIFTADEATLKLASGITDARERASCLKSWCRSKALRFLVAIHFGWVGQSEANARHRAPFHCGQGQCRALCARQCVARARTRHDKAPEQALPLLLILKFRVHSFVVQSLASSMPSA